MNKSKFVSSKGNRYIIVKGLKGQQLSQNEVYDINNNKVEGLLHMEVIKSGSTFKLSYNVSGLITLKDYLKSPLSIKAFVTLLENILSALKSMESMFLKKEHLLMDFNRVMVHPSTKDIFFVYMPILGLDTGINLKDFLLDIIKYSSFVGNENNSFITRYIQILNEGINFSVFDLEEYIKHLGHAKADDGKIMLCPRCHARLKPNSAYCERCGEKIAKTENQNGNTATYDPLSNSKNISMNYPPDGGTGVDEPYRSFDNYNNQYAAQSGLRAYIVRAKTNESAAINVSDFVIGKDLSCNFEVSGNRAISRRHAEIFIVNDKYYITDLESTNRTYVNGIEVKPGIKMEIINGSRIKLANEDFWLVIK